MGILKLPDEMLLAIAANMILPPPYHHYGDTPSPSRVLSNLSQVSKRLNSICGAYIFRNYRIQIRDYSRKKTVLPNRRYDDLTRDVPLLLAHARSKSAYIRHLTIVDIGSRSIASDVRFEAFSAEIMADVYRLVEAIPGLVGFKLQTFESEEQFVDFSVALWSILEAKTLSSLCVLGSFVIPTGLNGRISVDELELTYFTGTARLLEASGPIYPIVPDATY